LEDTDASIVLVIPSTAKTVLNAIERLKKKRIRNNIDDPDKVRVGNDSENDWIEIKNDPESIRVLCFGEAEGCQNIFDLLDKVNKHNRIFDV
jgi:hypothetical protein